MMRKDIMPAFIAIVFAGGGLWGLAHSIQYSGWLLAVGVLMGLFHNWGGGSDCGCNCDCKKNDD